MKIQEWNSQLIEVAADTLAFWFEKTAEPDRGWTPSSEQGSGRSAHDQLTECVNVNTAFAALLRGTKPDAEKTFAPDEIAEALRASGSDLASAVLHMSDEDFERIYDAGWAQIRGKKMIQLALGNMYYHGGQINLIQLLKGDKTFHMPDDFLQ